MATDYFCAEMENVEEQYIRFQQDGATILDVTPASNGRQDHTTQYRWICLM